MNWVGPEQPAKHSLRLSFVSTLLEPGPVVLLSTSLKGRANVMTMSWLTMIEFKPPLVGCVISDRSYSYGILKATGECVINVPTVEQSKPVVGCGALQLLRPRGRQGLDRPGAQGPADAAPPRQGSFMAAEETIKLPSKMKWDPLADKALAAGGAPSKEPYDFGWMYGRSFQDPDGHLWEVFWMDPAGPPKG